MKRNKLLLLLVLLMTAATGAWADETPLLTIESKDYVLFTSESKTFDDKVTVTFSNGVYNDGDDFGWYSSGTTGSLLTVAGINGYTITSCKFYTNGGGALNFVDFSEELLRMCGKFRIFAAVLYKRDDDVPPRPTYRP